MKKNFIVCGLALLIGVQSAGCMERDKPQICDDCIGVILEFLPPADIPTWKLVSKDIHELADAFWWRNYVRREVEVQLDYGFFKKLSQVENLEERSEVLRWEIQGKMRHKRSLLTLDCKYTSICDSDLALIAKYFGANIYKLKLDGCCKITVKGMEAISNLENLCHLSLAKCKQLDDTWLKPIGKLFNLRVLLFLQNKNLTGKQFGELTKLSKLQELIIDECYNVENEGVKKLTNLRNLRSLVLLYCKKVTDNGVESFLRHQRLQVIDLMSTGVTDNMKKLLRARDIKVI